MAVYRTFGLWERLALAAAILVSLGAAWILTRPEAGQPRAESNGTPDHGGRELNGRARDVPDGWMEAVLAEFDRAGPEPPGFTRHGKSEYQQVQGFVRRLANGEVSRVSGRQFADLAMSARVYLCNDTHNYCLSAVAMRRFLEWLVAEPWFRREGALLLVEWIPSSGSGEFDALARRLRGQPRDLRIAVASFLRKCWPWPVSDHADSLALAVSHGIRVRGVGPSVASRMPGDDVPDRDRSPVEAVSVETYDTLMRAQNDTVVRLVEEWIGLRGEGRRVIVMSGSIHNLALPSGVRAKLGDSGVATMTLMNGLRSIDSVYLRRATDVSSRGWFDFGSGVVCGPLLSPRDWLQYVAHGR